MQDPIDIQLRFIDFILLGETLREMSLSTDELAACVDNNSVTCSSCHGLTPNKDNQTRFCCHCGKPFAATGVTEPLR